MGRLGDGLEIRDVVAGVADALNVHSLGLVVDLGNQVLDLVSNNKLCVDSKAGQENLQLVVCAAVEVGCRDNVVADLRQGGNGDKLGCLARGCRKSSDTALQGCDSLLEHINRGAAAGRLVCVSGTRIVRHLLHYPGVDVAKLLEAEQASAMGGIIEHKALVHIILVVHASLEVRGR